jgi:peptide/nickel transport system permease protein
MRILGHKLSITAQIGLVIIALNLIIAIFASLIAPYDQTTVLGDAWADPDWQHWLGLDNLGRDLLSRLIYGARMSLASLRDSAQRCPADGSIRRCRASSISFCQCPR